MSLVHWLPTGVVRGLKRLGGGELAIIFRETAAYFRQRRIRRSGCSKFQFLLPLKFPRNGAFPAANFVFLKEKFPTRRKFSEQLKFGGGNCPSSPLS